MVVKIDNVDAARPQTGPNQADVVYEEEVEGGLTRLAAVFQSQYPAVVGPVRSGRLTDEAIADDLNHPVFAYSGTNAIFLPILRSQPLTDVDDDNHPNLFYRSNLGVEPAQPLLQCRLPGRCFHDACPSSPLFHFLPASGHFTGPGLAPDAHIGLGLAGGGGDMGLERGVAVVAAGPERHRRHGSLRGPTERHQRGRPVRSATSPRDRHRGRRASGPDP